MKIFVNPERELWSGLCRRPSGEASSVAALVRGILDDVRSRGDAAIAELTERFDGCRVDASSESPFRVSFDELRRLAATAPTELTRAIESAIENISAFHRPQLGVVESSSVETAPGVRCFRRRVSIERVGLYIPGGTAPLFSTLMMLAVPARIAGCAEIVVVTPPSRDGTIHPAIAAVCVAVGIDRVFAIGGAQAVAALAYGTESVPKVDKILGPGNRFVTEAKMQVASEGTAIDLPAGPSEVLVIADDGADAALVSADLLAQAEHGADSQVVFLTTSRRLMDEVAVELPRQLDALPRVAIARRSIENSLTVLFDTIDHCVEFSNLYAPEHLILALASYDQIVGRITNAGSVFLGYLSAEAFGDYASGTNHVLPTNGCARGYSGVSVDSFMKTISFQSIDRTGVESLGATVVALARAEGLEAHARAVLIRKEEGND